MNSNRERLRKVVRLSKDQHTSVSRREIYDGGSLPVDDARLQSPFFEVIMTLGAAM